MAAKSVWNRRYIQTTVKSDPMNRSRFTGIRIFEVLKEADGIDSVWMNPLPA